MTDKGKLEYVNRRWLEFTGAGSGSDTAEADRWQELLHPGDREAFVARWRESLETKAALMAECRLRDRSTGRYRWFLFRATPVRDEPFAKLRWYSTFTDIDQQKATELTLQRTNEDLQQFVFSASHDLQEPLRILMLYSQRIRSRSSENLNEEMARDLGFVSDAAGRMSSLVSDLLTYTQVASSETEAEQACDATVALRNTLEILGNAIRATEASVTYGELPKVHITESQLQEILKNLIGNALKYRMTGLAPRITIDAKADGSEWVFSVRDNGIGIDPVFHERIFGIFKRLHTTSQYPGTGLGLAICKKIVERHHGRIWVESNLGRGSTFFFSLPANPDPPTNKHG